MSIYRSRSQRSPEVAREPAAGPRPKPARVGGAPSAPPVQDPATLRKAKPVNYLLPASIQWFESLPRGVRPVALTTHYARIVNLIVRQWNENKACCAYFDDLLTDRRGNRQGFPRDVYRELKALREYYLRLGLSGDDGLSLL